MGTVVITGADAPLGRRVAALAAADSEVGPVVALADGPVLGLPDDVDVRRIDLATDDVKPHLEGAESVLHLATSVPPWPTAPTSDVEWARRVFEAAGDAAVPHLLVLSSATVYGAWPNNPVPLTEEATLRPNPGFAFAAERAEIERLASEWRGAHPVANGCYRRCARVPQARRRPTSPPSSSWTSMIWPPPSIWAGGDDSTVPSTWRPTDPFRATRSAR
jgi:UDP-glucose 4-epimerase